MSRSTRRGAAAGVVAAAAWAVAEPGLRRLAGTPYSDVRLLGRVATRGRGWPAAGLAIHLGNGALFGATFARLGLRGVKAGVLAAEAENLVLWPGLLVVDRVHPDRREGNWPPLTLNPRVAAYAVAAHALFGFVLGRLTERPARGTRSRAPRPSGRACRGRCRASSGRLRAARGRPSTAARPAPAEPSRCRLPS